LPWVLGFLPQDWNNAVKEFIQAAKKVYHILSSKANDFLRNSRAFLNSICPAHVGLWRKQKTPDQKSRVLVSFSRTYAESVTLFSRWQLSVLCPSRQRRIRHCLLRPKS
jgi:hypothetical protein